MGTSTLLDIHKAMAVQPLRKLKKVHKRTKKFIRCEFHDYPGKLKAQWRRPRGQDNTCRRKMRGSNRLVKIGYGSNKKTRHVLPNGFKKFLIRNAQDLELLLMNNRRFCGEIAHSVGGQLRKKLITRAAELNVVLTNAKGKVATEEKPQNE